MYLIIIFAALLLILIAVLCYFFSIAFVRVNRAVSEGVNFNDSETFSKYSDIIRSGADFINMQPHRWVFTTSFDGVKLAARYYNQNSDKTILLFHGYRSSALHDFCCAVKPYYEMGFNILLVDQRSHGRSEGKLITFGVKESRDVLTWINFLNARYGEKQLVLGGISMGGTTVLLATGEELPQNVKAVISDCGFTSPKDIIKKVAKQSFRINAAPVLPLMDLGCRIFGSFSIMTASTVEAVKNTEIPILFIHGEDDNFVPCEMSRLTYEAAGDRCYLLTVPGADHGLSYLVDKNTVTQRIESFLEECLD